MLKTIFSAAGLPAWPSRCSDPPSGNYAIYFDEVTVDGPDIPGVDCPLIFTHACMVELYEPTQDDAVEAAFEAELKARGILWTKQARYWLQSTQRYQVIYEFTYTEKRRT